jgi:hypothetical protein
MPKAASLFGGFLGGCRARSSRLETLRACRHMHGAISSARRLPKMATPDSPTAQFALDAGSWVTKHATDPHVSDIRLRVSR